MSNRGLVHCGSQFLQKLKIILIKNSIIDSKLNSKSEVDILNASPADQCGLFFFLTNTGEAMMRLLGTGCTRGSTGDTAPRHFGNGVGQHCPIHTRQTVGWRCAVETILWTLRTKSLVEESALRTDSAFVHIVGSASDTVVRNALETSVVCQCVTRRTHCAWRSRRTLCRRITSVVDTVENISQKTRSTECSIYWRTSGAGSFTYCDTWFCDVHFISDWAFQTKIFCTTNAIIRTRRTSSIRIQVKTFFTS